MSVDQAGARPFPTGDCLIFGVAGPDTPSPIRVDVADAGRRSAWMVSGRDPVRGMVAGG